jgi:hypothetical protein
MCIEKKRIDFSLLVYSIPRPKRAAYAPPDPVLMEKARQVRMNEIKMWSVIREILFYSFFLWILMVISYRNRSQLMYTYKNSMEQVFIVTNNTNHSFMKVNSLYINIIWNKGFWRLKLLNWVITSWNGNLWHLFLTHRSITW